MTTLQQLSDSWNVLRAAAVGKGTQIPPGVASETADRVAQAHEEFQAWLATQGPLDWAAAQVTLSADGQVWADLQAELAELVSEQTGKRVPHAPETPITTAMREVKAVASGTASIVLLGFGAYLAARLIGRKFRY